jgi:hypothetical protein
LRTISCITVFVVLLPTGLLAQTTLPIASVPAQAAVHDPGRQIPLVYRRETAPANILRFSWDSRAVYDYDLFSVDQQGIGDEVLSFCPSNLLHEPSERQGNSLNYSPFWLTRQSVDPLNRLKQGLDRGPDYASNRSFMSDPRNSHAYLLGGLGPSLGDQILSAHKLPTDLDLSDYASGEMLRADTPVLDALHSTSENAEMAFLKVARQGESPTGRMRDKVIPVILSLAVHAAVTWDAQSTNHFFRHCPKGYRPAEADPLLRPFAGRALMYPMANLFLAAPIDLLLLRTRHSPRPIRILTYVAASVWVGVEIRQSITNMRNEHLTALPASTLAQAIARMQ